MNSRVLYGVVGVVVVVVFVQMFLRYTYISHGYQTLRIDRVTGSSCTLPCTAAPPETPKPQPTFDDIALGNNRAIKIVQDRDDAQNIVAYHPDAKYRWFVESEYSPGYGVSYGDVEFNYGAANVEKSGPPVKGHTYAFITVPPNAPQFAPAPSSANPDPTPYPLHYPIREICYCDPKAYGWRWEVHLDTGEVFRVDGNAALSARYGLATPKP